jgi:threonyl-tRNA synthetase
VGEGHREAAHALRDRLAAYRVDLDERDETVGKRIRDAELEKIPYVLVYGDKEIENDELSIRTRGEDGLRKEPVEDFVRQLAKV